MYSYRILGNKLFDALIVCAVLIAFIKFGPAEIREGTVAALLVVIGSIGTSVANDRRTYKANKAKESRANEDAPSKQDG